MATKAEREKELARICRRDGCVRASVVVHEAKAKRNPLHGEFEWDDAKAAHEHRLSVARRIIRVTDVRIDNGPKQRLVHVPSVTIDGPTASTRDPEGTYKPMAVVVRDPSEYQRALQELLGQIRALERSVHELRKAAGEEPQMLPTLLDAMQVAKDTVRLMLDSAA